MAEQQNDPEIKPKRDALGRILPGQSGNPGGRPRELSGLRELIREHGPSLVQKLLSIARGEDLRDVVAGDSVVQIGPSHSDQIRASEVLLSYWVGKPTQAVEVSGPDGEPLHSGTDLSRLTSEELHMMTAIMAKTRPRGT
jgi:hypothetical protein